MDSSLYMWNTINNNLFICRKVLTESATGSSTSNRVRTVLTIEVESIYFDTDANMLGLKGKNIQENEYVKVYISILA